jgi:type 1 glutamine amidotransferase
MAVAQLGRLHPLRKDEKKCRDENGHESSLDAARAGGGETTAPSTRTPFHGWTTADRKTVRLFDVPCPAKRFVIPRGSPIVMKLRPSFAKLLALVLAFAPALPLAAANAPKKVLVVTVTTGFRHSSIPVAEKVLEQLARESGQFTVEFVRQPEGQPRTPARPRPGPKGADDPAHQAALKKFAEDERNFRETWMPKVSAALQKLSPANLRNYDAVVFASTSGDDLPLPDPQGFVDWVASGKGFVGVHAASDTLRTFAPYVSMLGGAFRVHGPQVTVECINEDQAHAACKHLPRHWTVYDEIYQLKDFERAKVHGLLSLDRLMLTQKDKDAKKATPGDYPISWTRMHGRGRVFYTSLGHREDVWDPAFKDKNGRMNSPEVARQFQQHLLGGILWAVGR